MTTTTPQLVTSPELLPPLLTLGGFVLASLIRPARQAAEAAVWASKLMLAGSLFAALAVFLTGPVHIHLWSSGAASASLLLDAVSVLMLVLVSFLGLIVARYSMHYMAGEPGHARFSRWLVATLGCVLVLLASGNLLQFALAWVGTSLCLHQLLIHYRERPSARRAARKKFIISRLGDLCMVGALVAAWRAWGTWEFHEMFVLADQRSAGIVAGCLIAAAIMKSAQFPFHSWLPDTMETPTPVSALMHAGIINAGGFLVVRLSPVLVHSSTALHVLAIIGAFTALFASVTLLVQPSIKRALAWSTVAQMGFMMLQCGLGAFSLAMLHIVAHALYKAHAFLSSGSVVRLAASTWTPVGRPAAHPLVVGLSLLTAMALAGGAALLLGLKPGADPGRLLLAGVFVMAMAHMLWTLWSSSMRRRLIGRGILLVAGIALASLALHAAFDHMLAGVLPAQTAAWSTAETLMAAAVGLMFLAVLAFQSQLPLWASRPFFARLYVHASNGFYLGAWLSKLTGRLPG